MKRMEIVRDEVCPNDQHPPSSEDTTLSKPCHFFRLPAELREPIYEYALTLHYRDRVLSVLEESHTKTSSIEHPLLNVCRSIRQESLPDYLEAIANFAEQFQEYVGMARAANLNQHWISNSVKRPVLSLDDREEEKKIEERLFMKTSSYAHSAVKVSEVIRRQVREQRRKWGVANEETEGESEEGYVREKGPAEKFGFRPMTHDHNLS